MSEETSSAAPSAESTTSEGTESQGSVSRETDNYGRGTYVRPDDADEYVPTKWNKHLDPDNQEDSEDDDSEDVETEEQTKEDILEANDQLVKIKVDGKEAHLPLKELVARAQKGAAADKRMQEAAEVRKQATGLINALQKDPFSILARPEFGLGDEKLRELAEAYVYDKVQYEQMNDEEREHHEKMKEYERLKEEKEQWEAQKNEQEQKQHLDRYSQDIQSALEANNLPKSPLVVKRIAFYMKQAYQNGHKNVSAKEVAPQVKKDLIEEAKSLKNDDEALFELLGEDGLKKVREKELSKVRKGGSLSRPTTQGRPMEASQRKQPKKLSINEWRERNRAMLDND